MVVSKAPSKDEMTSSFWGSVGGGFTLLSYWQVWVAAVTVAAATVGFQVAVASQAKSGGDGTPSPAGCLTLVIGGSVVQGLALSAAFTWLLPLIVGRSYTMPVDVITSNLGAIVVAGLIGMAAVILVSLVPAIGRSDTLAAFAQGVVVCRVLTGSSVQAGISYPGLLPSLGFVAIAAAFAAVAVVATAILAMSLRQADDQDMPHPIALVAGVAVRIVSGFLPVFMYMRYAVMSHHGRF